MNHPDGYRGGGIDLRTALIILGASELGLIAGILAYIALGEWALAVIVGGSAVGGTSSFLNRVIARADR
jgi:hypothetical protein